MESHGGKKKHGGLSPMGVVGQPTRGVVGDTRYLKELLLANLDLIQNQQELMLAKDKKIQQLTHENETVKKLRNRPMRRSEWIFLL